MRHFNLDLSEDLADRIAAVAIRNHISKTEALLRALDLLFGCMMATSSGKPRLRDWHFPRAVSRVER